MKLLLVLCLFLVTISSAFAGTDGDPCETPKDCRQVICHREPECRDHKCFCDWTPFTERSVIKDDKDKQ
ncbi:unnamed protein product [Bursaphelenchus okinawaensis]|uniref:Uncharacterized protein n=1 Tax=Bursaphelenchus okinawaensis TaxID=465554 RepID=A0A811KEC9_9BILA|nr:unnamed protein product [Bursaphelenchus okinawaensis]CAG9101664.1 unnamed protein product [Bursaphelenchus okinawaensis]